jgi:hypothetical protein
MTGARDKSILDGFWRPSEPLDVLRAVRSLGDLSRGEVKTGSLLASRTGAPERDGLLCERLFGPVKNHECRCGLLGGPRGRPPSFVGERCPKCGVEAISPRSREERFAHVDIPVPVLHPALAKLVAEALSWSEADVRDVVFLRAWIDEAGRVHPNGTEDRYEHLDRRGASIVRERLADISSGELADTLRAEGFKPEDLLIQRVPVVPPGDRPLVSMPGGHAMPGPDNLAYSSLIERRNRMARLLELNAPEIILAHEAAAVNERFAALWAQMSGERSATMAAWQMDPDEDEAQEGSDTPGSPVSIPPDDLEGSFTKPPDPTRPVSGAILEDGSVLLQYSYAILHIAKTGRILRVIPAVGHQILATTADSRHVLTQRIGLHLYDLREGRWSTEVPDELPCVYMDEAQEQALLIDTKKGGGRMLHEVADYPDLYVSSPDGRFLWVEDKERSGGVFSAETALCVLLPGELRISEEVPSVLRRDGTRLSFNDDAEDRWPERPTFCAIALARSDRFVLVDFGVVAIDDQPHLLLEPPLPAVALSRSGEQLLVFRRAEAHLVTSWNGEPLARFDVSALEADLALTALGKLPRKARQALLTKFGGTWGMAAAPPAEIAAVEGVGKAQATAIARALKRSPPVGRIAAKRSRS